MTNSDQLRHRIGEEGIIIEDDPMDDSGSDSYTKESSINKNRT